MPKDEKNFKRQVRDRMSRTDESYTTARAHLEAQHEEPTEAFFDRTQPEPSSPPHGRRMFPSWGQPPEDELGGVVPLSLVIAHTDEIAIALATIVAYTSGFSMTITTVNRAFKVPTGPGDRPHYSQPQIGLRWSDGTKSTTDQGGIPRMFGSDLEELAKLIAPPRPLLSWRGGGGSGVRTEHQLWAAPLPPAGPLDIFVAWGENGVDEIGARLDAGEILLAAARAQPIWPSPKDPL